jgi:hypothetical protein
VQQGTEAAPDDGRYYLVVDDEIVLSTGVEALALAEFEERRAERQADGRAYLRQERAAGDVRAFRAGNFAEKSSRDRAKGGRGVGRR